jgi:ADP-heptose:LPS heptosyltransferase/glycosyltransferase involved in cell wall biosynthesis
MRILVITGGYPPHDLTDQALGCRDIVEALKARGHRVRVLTSIPSLRKPRKDDDILSWLIRNRKNTIGWQQVFLKEAVNQAAFEIAARDFRPDIVFLFDFSQISASLALLARAKGLPVCYHVSTDGLAGWEADRWYQEQPKGARGYKVLRHLVRRYQVAAFSAPLELDRAIFTSRYLEASAAQVGKSPAHPTVIPWGVDTHRFIFKESDGREPKRLLYRGPLKPQKGVEIAIQALGLLKRDHGRDDLRLTIAGISDAFPDYLAALHDLADDCGVLTNVDFTEYGPARATPDLYLTHDIFVFPSVLVEPLAVPVLEAMACGLGIVATATGGQAEVLQDGVNALVIPKENPEACARAILRLLDQPDLYRDLRLRARTTIEERFRFEPAVESIEAVLTSAVGQTAADRSNGSGAEPPAIPERAYLKDLAKLADRVERSLKRGSFLVQVRNWFKPEKIKLKYWLKFRRSSSLAAIKIFPPLFEGCLKLRGRGQDRKTTSGFLPREILVVQLADLGDVILSGPFLRELRRFLPQARIVLAVQPSMVNVVEKCPYIDELRTFDWRAVRDYKNAYQGIPGWWLKAFRMHARNFKKDHFDLAVSLRWNNDPCQAASLILMYTSGAPQRLAYLDAAADYRPLPLDNLNRLTTFGPLRAAPKHEIEYQMDLLRFLGAHPEDTRPEVWTTPEDERVARSLLEDRHLAADGPLIAFAPGAAWAFRRWPAERFVELGRWLQENYRAVILIFAGQAERVLAATIEQGLDAARTVNLAGKTTIREMAAVLKSCAYFVGNDSGPMHVAVAAEVSVVGLFGPGEYERFKPWGPDPEVVRLGLTCNPCSENCKFAEALCIRGIPVSQVQSVLAEKLGPILK